jgi:DoxX-like family
MRWHAITLQALLGLMFLFSATSKLTGGAEEIRLHLGIAPWFWAVTAMVETFGAVGLLAGIKYPRLAVLAGLWLGATMLGGVLSHALVGDPPIDMLAATVLLALSLTVVALRWRAARIGDLLNAATSSATSRCLAAS